MDRPLTRPLPRDVRDLIDLFDEEARQDGNMTDSAQPDFSRRSTARIATTAVRYGKQLTSHMGRKITTVWSEDAKTGSLTFDLRGRSPESWRSHAKTASSSST